MILTGREIKKQVEMGRIHLNPFCEQFINPNSYNYRLSSELLEIDEGVIDPKRCCCGKRQVIGRRGFVLQPGRIYLGKTFEEIGSDFYTTLLIGRSSLGRLGLFLQITADLGHCGAKHCWTLELHAIQPLRVYPMMKIGQVSFWENKGPLVRYRGEYGRKKHPYKSNYYKKMRRVWV